MRKSHSSLVRDVSAKPWISLWSDVFFEDEITEQGEKVDNGYCFGKTEIYNPWSVLNYIRMGENVFLTMAIPNTEIKTIYKDSISYWFDQRMKETDREHS